MVSAALASAHQARIIEERGGAGLVELLPALSAAPLDVVARQLWLDAGFTDGRLTAPQQARLEIAARQLARAGYGAIAAGEPGAAVAALADLAAGDWAEWWDVSRKQPKPPATLGGLVECLAKLARRAAKGRRARRNPERSAAMVAWRAIRRQPRKPDSGARRG